MRFSLQKTPHVESPVFLYVVLLSKTQSGMKWKNKELYTIVFECVGSDFGSLERSDERPFQDQN